MASTNPLHQGATTDVEMVAPPAATPSGVGNRFRLALRDGRGLALEHSDIDATHGKRAFMIRMSSAADAITVEINSVGAVVVVGGHHTLGYSLDNWYGKKEAGNRQHFSTWEQRFPAKQWQLNLYVGSISTPPTTPSTLYKSH